MAGVYSLLLKARNLFAGGGASAAVLKFSVTANIFFFFFHGILTKYSICTPYLEGFLYTKSKKCELNKGLQHCWGIF